MLALHGLTKKKSLNYYSTFFFILLTKNKAIADNKANTSKACPELPKILFTKKNNIQTTNQTSISILTYVFWIRHTNFIVSCINIMNFTSNTTCHITK